MNIKKEDKLVYVPVDKVTPNKITLVVSALLPYVDKMQVPKEEGQLPFRYTNELMRICQELSDVVSECSDVNNPKVVSLYNKFMELYYEG